MTVANSLNKHTYVGNGVTTSFPYTFKIFKSTDIQVILTDIETGDETLLSSNYTVNTSTNTVTYPVSGTPLTSATKITLNRSVPITQETALPNGGPYLARVIEAAFDKDIIIDQQLQAQIDRTLKFAITVPDDFSRSLPAPVALKALRINSNATAFEYTTDPEIAANQAAASAAAALTSENNSATSAASAATSATNSAASAATIGGFLDYTATAKTLDIITKGPWVDVRAFGATGGGIADDAQAIRDAIAYAVTIGAGEILFPYGGTFLCSTPIVDGTALPEGLTFKAYGKKGGTDAAEGTVIKYTGTDICWKIYEPNGIAQVGNWKWKDITFQCTDVNGGMFSFNDVSLEATDTSATPNYIRNVKFENCKFWGEGTSAVNANAIQGLKSFEIITDENCEFRGWKRGIYLKGCDNCTIRGRFLYNVRHIMTARSNTFGNALTIDSRFLGPTIKAGVESSRCLHIESMNTNVYDPFFEDTTGIDTFVYINHISFNMYNPFYSVLAADLNILKVGVSAKNTVIYSPTTSSGLAATITYDTPTNWQWVSKTVIDQSYKLEVYSPSYRVFKWLAPHPRLQLHSMYSTEDNVTNGSINSVGEYLERYQVNPMHIERAERLSGFNFINNVITDTDGYHGYTIQLGTTNYSCVLRLVSGVDFQEGQVLKISVRYKNETTPTTGALRYVVEKNNTAVTNSALPNSTTYTLQSSFYTVSGSTKGDVYCFGVYNTADTLADVANIIIEVVPESGSWGTAAPTSGVWTVGKVVKNTAPTLIKNIDYWRCITAGTPGVWLAHGIGTGTTVQRPTLTANDAGYGYKDTTTSTLVVWNGTAWV